LPKQALAATFPVTYDPNEIYWPLKGYLPVSCALKFSFCLARGQLPDCLGINVHAEVVVLQQLLVGQKLQGRKGQVKVNGGAGKGRRTKGKGRGRWRGRWRWRGRGSGRGRER
jgi:hypothetical protein